MAGTTVLSRNIVLAAHTVKHRRMRLNAFVVRSYDCTIHNEWADPLKATGNRGGKPVLSQLRYHFPNEDHLKEPLYRWWWV